MGSPDRQLSRDLGFQQLFFVSFGSIIGSGWLFAALAASALAGPASLVSWVLGAVLIIFIALNYAEVSAMMPRSGAVVRYPHLTHGGYLGFVMSWAFLISVVSTTAIESLAVVTYAAGYVNDWIGVDLTTTARGVTLLTTPGIIATVLLMVFFFLVNVFGVKFFGEFNRWVTWWKLVIPVLTFVHEAHSRLRYRGPRRGGAPGRAGPARGSPQHKMKRFAERRCLPRGKAPRF